MTRARNIFLIGRQPRAEDQLTEMLVWLAETVPAVRAKIAELGLRVDDIEPGEIEVSTQHGVVVGRLDAFLTGPDFALIVESKLDSGYGEGQIRKYLEWLRSDAVSQPRRALMTLTAAGAPWSASDERYADANGIIRSARRWEELHAAFAALASAARTSEVSDQLVSEFLEMLSEEGLVPIEPLAPSEMREAWANAWAVVRRFRDFFHACKPEIAARTGMSQVSSSSSDRGDWFWQDYRDADGTRLVVGLYFTDENERLPPGAHVRAPIVWFGVLADHLPEWKAVSAWLGAHAPAGWHAGNSWWGRPTAWRYLSDVVGEGSFDEQRDRLAAAMTAAQEWLAAAPRDGRSDGEGAV
jgi:hypothetical protein